VTDPFSSGYLTFFAAVAAWAREVDRVCVVDGHSREDLPGLMDKLCGPMSNVEVLRTPATFWGSGDHWHLLQCNGNINAGIERLGDCDFVVVVGADYVPHPGVRLTLNQRATAGSGWWRFYRSKVGRSSYERRIDSRGIVLGPETPGALLLGVDRRSGLASDFPLVPEEVGWFADPITRENKRILAGSPTEPAGTVDIEVGVFGHFWYEPDACLAKLRRWNRAVARYHGIAPKRDAELAATERLHQIRGYRTKAELLGWDFPEEMKGLIDTFYRPGMLGGAILDPPSRPLALRERAHQLERRSRTQIMRSRGFRGFAEQQEWAALDVPRARPLPVAELQRGQDAILPGWARDAN